MLQVVFVNKKLNRKWSYDNIVKIEYSLLSVIIYDSSGNIMFVRRRDYDSFTVEFLELECDLYDVKNYDFHFGDSYDDF